jgi:hypothetical protein
MKQVTFLLLDAAIPSDASADAHAVQVAIWRRMTAEQRLATRWDIW